MRGPQILNFLALPRVDGCVFCCEESCRTTPTPTPHVDGLGRRVFTLRSGRFLLVLEGYRGGSNLQPGTSLEPGVDGRPDLQVQVDRPLGNGSVAVCDTGAPPVGGGVPALVPPRYDGGDAAVTNALNDFACRFETFDRSAPCTRTDVTGESRFVNPLTDRQYCDIVASTAEFPPGETLVTARLRDVGGNVGPTAQIVVRVATPTPAP